MQKRKIRTYSIPMDIFTKLEIRAKIQDRTISQVINDLVYLYVNEKINYTHKIEINEKQSNIPLGIK